MNNTFAHLMLQCSYSHDKRQRTQLSGNLVKCFLNLVVGRLPVLEASMLRNQAVAAAQTRDFAQL